MPLYEYLCKPNGHRFEMRQSYHDVPVTVCPECGGASRRVIQPVGIVFKGSGFYATDSRSTPTSTKPTETTSTDTDKPKVDAKTDTKMESSSDSTSTPPAKTDSGSAAAT